MEPLFKILPTQKKENSCCACMNAWRQSSKTSAASNPQGWFFCVHREILPLALKTSLFNFSGKLAKHNPSAKNFS